MRNGWGDDDREMPAARAARGDGPVVRRAGGVAVPARRSSTESWRWNEEIESAGRLSLRFCKYGGKSTAAQMTARMNSTKSVTLRAYLCDSGTVTLRAERVVDGGSWSGGRG